MSKITLNDLTSLTNQTSAIALINANNTNVETAIENTLSRDGTSPNQMTAGLDMNSNRISNLPYALSATEPVTLSQFEASGAVVGTAPNTVSYLTLATSAGLTSERVLTAGNGVLFTDAGAGSTLTISTSNDIKDIREFGWTSGNGLTALTAGITAGYSKFFFPTGSYYQGGGTGGLTGSTVTPANVELYAQDRSVLIKAVTRGSSTATGYIYLGANSKLFGFSSQSYNGDRDASPTTTQKDVYTRVISNISNTTSSYSPWNTDTQLIIGSAYTTNDSVVATDIPGIQVVQNSTGDGLYVGTATSSGIGLRLETYGVGDTGILLLNGQNGTATGTNQHTGLYIKEYGKHASGAGAVLSRQTSSTTPLLYLHDIDATGPFSATWVNYVMARQASGAMFNLYQTVTPFSGQFFYMNAGNSGGTFTGEFIRCEINSSGTPVFNVDYTGAVKYGIWNAGAVTSTAITSSGVLKSSSPSSGVGYATGAGLAATQGTSRTTTVPINAVSGAITLFSAAGSATPATFTVTNTSVAATDTISLSQKSGTDKYILLVTAVAANSFNITFYTTGGTTTETPVINFNVIKGVTS